MAQPRPRKSGDARSGTSSFYGAQSTSHDRRNSRPSRPEDSQSTFFGRNGEDYNPQQLQYESDPLRDQGEGPYSPFAPPPDAIEPVKGGVDEEFGAGGAWDVYADFNNTGPRYSTVPFTASMKSNDGYRPLKPPEPLSSRGGSRKAASSAYEPQVELVTVPAMGAEWSVAELEDMKQSTKRKQKARERKRAWREFARDEKGLCGIPWLTRKKIVWGTFGFCITLGLLLFFLIPRAPNFGFAFGQPLVNNGGPTPYFNLLPANFSFTGGIDLQADTHNSYVPIHMNNLTAYLYTSATDKLVATGTWGPETMKARSFTPVMINMTFAYAAINSSDPTWNLVHDACKNVNQYPNATRPGLNIRLVLEMDIRGLIGTQGASTFIEDAACPIMLPTNAV